MKKKPTTEKETIDQGWNETVLNTLDSVVETANNKIVKPAHKFAKFFVYTIVASILILVILIVFSIASFRVLNLALPVWGSYMAIGAVFILIGSIFWIKK